LAGKKYDVEESPEIYISMGGKKISDPKGINFEQLIEDRGEFQIDLSLDKKRVELTFMENSDHKICACSIIKNIPKDGKSEKGTTTLLYKKAKLILQEAANQLNMNVRYDFSTDLTLPNVGPNPMRRWNTKKGKDLFEWDKRDGEKQGNCLMFKKTFYPETQESDKKAA
jgi:hypothetical protein